MPYRLFLVLLLLRHQATCRLVPRIVGGEYTTIKEFPHSVHLSVQCTLEENAGSWVCGSSVVNQWLLLSVAHCVDDCTSKSTYISARPGHTDRSKSEARLVAKFMCHEDYDNINIVNDICLYKLKEELQLGPTVSRVILMKNPPYNEPAKVAGWGYIDDEKETTTHILKQLKNMEVYSREECEHTLPSVPEGTICAQVKPGANANNYTARGDSGSALVVRDDIQIGLISYCEQQRSRTLTVYSDVGYFFDWIRKTAEDLVCSRK